MYHDVVEDGAEDSSGFPGRDAALYKVSRAQLRQHMTAIASLPRQLHPEITFDDGGVTALVAADVLELHGLAGYFFVTTNFIRATGFLDGPQIRELRARGHRIGTHSCSHPLRMGRVPWPRLLEEWRRSRATLSDLLGEDVRTGSIPGGHFRPSVARAAAEAGLRRLFTSEPTPTGREAFGVELLGRYTIRRKTPALTVRSLARGAWLPRARQAVSWNAKKVAKEVGGEGYLRLRALVLGRHAVVVRWGDRS
jgi:peptidoglycan/xylan/chitin deacetylase (PgdA/CDA1 family)